MSAIVIQDLKKKIGRKQVFQGLNLEVLEGEFFGVLGLHDAGKSTLAKLMLSFLKPGAGSISIFDMDARKNPKGIKEFCAFVSQDLWMPENLRPDQLFHKTLSFYGTKNTEELEELKDYFNFSARSKFKDLTLEEKKITAFINALMVKPKLLILDDPLTGVSEDVGEKLLMKLKDLQKRENLTIFMLTDDLPVIQRFADRAAFLHDGLIQNVESLQDSHGRDKVLKILGGREHQEQFLSLGAKVAQENAEGISYYYDGDLQRLSQAIAEFDLNDYTLENAGLQDKMTAYYSHGGEVQ